MPLGEKPEISSILGATRLEDGYRRRMLRKVAIDIMVSAPPRVKPRGGFARDALHYARARHSIGRAGDYSRAQHSLFPAPPP